MLLKKKLKKKSKEGKHLWQANTIVLIFISRWMIKDDDDKDDDDKDDNDDDDNNDDDNDNDNKEDDNKEDDDEDDNGREDGYNNDDDDDGGFWKNFRNNYLRFSGNFGRILGIVFYDFLGILKGF